MSLPSNLTTTSPGSMPAGFAGPLSSTPAISAPRARLDVEAFGDLVGDLLDADAEPAAAQLAELPELIDHAGHRLRRHRKADADRAARRRDDQRVDADHLAVEVEQRTAGIAAVDGGVGLDVTVIGTGVDVAVARRDDARRDRAAEAERIADRDHPFAEPQLVGIAELHRDQRLGRLEFQHRKIGLLVDADQLGLELGAVVHDDADLVGIGDDVIVGHDDAGGVDDEAGAERVGLVRLQIAALRTARTAMAVLEEIVEEFLERRARRQLRHGAPAVAAALGLDGLRGRDVDHRVDDLLGDIGDAVGAARQGRHRRQDAGDANAGAKADRGQQRAQAMAQGWNRTGHIRSLSWKNGSQFESTVRPNGVTAQAFERDISCHERAPNTAKTRRGGSRWR